MSRVDTKLTMRLVGRSIVVRGGIADVALASVT
jgi:hypothetical protein